MRYDAIVIGLGAMGSSAAYHLARRGAAVLGLEAFARGHVLGSSGGRTRIIRLAYYEHPDYVPLARAAWDAWRELEHASGAVLLVPTGGLYIGPTASAFVAGSLRSARTHGLPHEPLAAGAIRERFPLFRIDDDWQGLYEEQAGYIVPERAIEAHLRMAERHGATLRFDTRVTTWRDLAGGVLVETASEAFEADRIVVTAGAWTSGLLPHLAPLLDVERVPVFWFEPVAELKGFATLPIFMADDAFYGCRYLPDEGLKVARHHSGVRCDPDTVDRTASVEDERVVRDFIRARLPLADGPLRDSLVCMYTNTPDRDFIIDRSGERVAYASACSGHGFKFSTVFGEVLADLVLDGRTAQPIGFLGASRFARIAPAR